MNCYHCYHCNFILTQVTISKDSTGEAGPSSFSLTSPFPSQQTLPVDLSSSSVRSAGNSGASFHGSTSAFDPCCPGSTLRPPAFVSQATPGPSQPAVVDSFSSSIVAQPQTQPQPCRHYMHPPCEYATFMHDKEQDFHHCFPFSALQFITFSDPFYGQIKQSMCVLFVGQNNKIEKILL